MFYIEENQIRIAIDRAGGPTLSSNLLGVANNTIYTWINNRRIPNIKIARKLAELAGMKVEDLRPTK